MLVSQGAELSPPAGTLSRAGFVLEVHPAPAGEEIILNNVQSTVTLLFLDYKSITKIK